MTYAVPWDRTVLIGTTDTFFDGDKDSLPVAGEAIEYLLAGVNRYFPRAALTTSDVLASFVGARPLVGSDGGHREDELPRDDQILYSVPGIWAVTGGKLTTYRAMARRVVDQVVRQQFADRRLRPCSTTEPLPGALRALPPNASQRLRALWTRYGAQAEQIEELIRQSPQLCEQIDEGAPYLWAEVVYAREHEYVERVDDLLDRRLGVFLLAPRGPIRARIETWFASQESTPVARTLS